MKYEFSASLLLTAALGNTITPQNKALHTGYYYQRQGASTKLLQWSLTRGSLKAQHKASVGFREAV